MFKICAFVGVLTHLVAGIGPMIATAAQSQPINWIAASMHAVWPGVAGVAAAMLTLLMSRPPEVLAPIDTESRA